MEINHSPADDMDGGNGQVSFATWLGNEMKGTQVVRLAAGGCSFWCLIFRFHHRVGHLVNLLDLFEIWVKCARCLGNSRVNHVL